jgi:poly(hydroxyalkanoate) granule-associated protein
MARARKSSGRGRGAARETSAQSQLLQGVQQVWLAGMGAIARAQQEGPGAFQDAVAEGVRLLGESRTVARRVVREALGGSQQSLQSRVGSAARQAQDTWDTLEAAFQGRVQRALQQLGVPTADEIRLLTRRVAELNDSVRRMGGRGQGSKAGGARRAPARRRASAARRPRTTPK